MFILPKAAPVADETVLEVGRTVAISAYLARVPAAQRPEVRMGATIGEGRVHLVFDADGSQATAKITIYECRDPKRVKAIVAETLALLGVSFATVGQSP